MTEDARLRQLRAFFGAEALPAGVEIGIGDDAAVLVPGNERLVWTVDAAVEGVHFRREWMSFADVGWRSLMAAASDLAAMGAAPQGVLSALILPPSFRDDQLEALARGQSEAARAIGTAVIGGNLSGGQELSITTSVLGRAAAPISRGGAQPGDVIAIAGLSGLAGAGLEALGTGNDDPRLATAIAAYRRPHALVSEGLAAAAIAHAAIDVSDGLALDASRLAAESQVAVVLEADLVLSTGGNALGRAAEALGLDPLEFALHGGEDYALLMAFGPNARVPGFVPIGRCDSGAGIWLSASDGTRREIKPRGFDHFVRR